MTKNLLLMKNNFVPTYKPCTDFDVELLQKFIDKSKKFAIITGAGISTESGLPDYRSKDVGLYSRSGGYRPMNYQEFLKNHSSRQRYWARSYLGWNYVNNCKPNVGHLTITEWQKKLSEKFHLIITQNVDRLHHKAGTESVYELHGNLYNVNCIQCNNRISRITFQKILYEMNSTIIDQQQQQQQNNEIRPDGDIDIIDNFIKKFQIPYCQRCNNGILKPDIIFFGDNISKLLLEKIYQKLIECDTLLIFGSSLKVFSIYRFIIHHLKNNDNNLLAIVNIGETRADTFINNKNIIKIDTNINDIITKIII